MKLGRLILRYATIRDGIDRAPGLLEQVEEQWVEGEL